MMKQDLESERNSDRRWDSNREQPPYRSTAHMHQISHSITNYEVNNNSYHKVSRLCR